MKSRFLLFAVALSTVIAFGCATPRSTGPIPSELPMYGGLDRQAIPETKAIDDALIEGTMKEFGSREAASERFVEQGFRYYFQDDLSTAMKRFNQGWLLNPSNPNVFHGFAAVLNDQENHCEARKMIQRALELGLAKTGGNLADAGRATTLCAMLDKSLSRDTKAGYLKVAYNYYVDALKISPNSAYVYGSWATASYWMGDYAAAWKYVKKERELGGKPGARFLQLLSEKMPEPR
jgi:tetratricopeptide (TPR) repeat protein